MRATIRTAVPALALIIALSAATPAAAESSRFMAHQFPQVGARYAGMGGGHVAVPGGVAGGYWNPALLSWSHHFEVVMEGSYTSGPKLKTMDEINSLRMQDVATFGAVGALFPGDRGFDYGFVEVTRYEHELKGSVFDSDANRGLNTVNNPDGGKAIPEYIDRATIRSFGMLASYRSGERHSLGIGLWVDRKKTFKFINYITPDCSMSHEAIINDFLDKEASTNDIAIRLNFGGVVRVSQNLDLGATIQTASNLKSTLDVDTWSTCTPDQELTAEVDDRTPLILQGGAFYRYSPGLRFAGDIVYQKWSDRDLHSNVAQINFGTEWTASDDVDLRAGIYTIFDPTDVKNDTEYAELLRDVQWSGNLTERNDLFLTFGVGYTFREYIRIDASVEDNHLTSPQSGQVSGRFAFRLFSENLEE